MDVKVILILAVQHGGRNVWYISSSITFSRDVNLELFDSKSLFEVEKEFCKIRSNIFLACSINVSNGESRPDRLFNPISMLASFLKVVSQPPGDGPSRS
jgi:hypothetical protein